MTRPRRLSARAFWGLASWILPLGVVFVVSPKLLHLLGAERFGVLMIALVTPLVASQIDLGIGVAAVRRLAGRFANGRVDGATIMTIFAALLTIGIGSAVIVWFAARPLADVLGFDKALGPDSGRDVVRACAAWMAVSLAAAVPGLVARAAQAVLLITVVQISTTVGLWVGAWALIASSGSLLRVVALGIALTLASAFATAWALRGLIDWRGSWRPRPALLTQDGRFALGMFAAQAAGAVVYQGDRLLVAALGTTAMAGFYALCLNIANKTAAAAVAVNSFVVPHAAGLLSEGQRGATVGLVHALDRAVAALVIPTLVPALLLAEPFFSLWLGEFASHELVMAFRILVVAFALPALAMPISNVLIASGQSGLSARFAWLAVVTLVTGMLLLVPRFGLTGAATAMLLANGTSLIFASAARRVLNVPPSAGRARFRAGLALGCAMQTALLIALAPVATGWLTLVAIGAITWAASYGVRAIVNLLSPEEQQLLRRVIDVVRGV